jgi:hypothetical protein
MSKRRSGRIPAKQGVTAKWGRLLFAHKPTGNPSMVQQFPFIEPGCGMISLEVFHE